MKAIFIGFLISVNMGMIIYLSSLCFMSGEDISLTIESLESKTSTGDKVFNKIQYLPGEQEDIWLMKQNHSNLKGEWDELKILIDKKEKPFKAYYFQIKNEQEIEFKVSCFKCHANGPRAIRPNYDSELVKYTLKDRLKVAYWNLKIKHYGEIITPQNTTLAGEFRKKPLKFEGFFDTQKFENKSCNLCHGKESLMGRANLQGQHKGTMYYLVKNNQMPPFPFSLTEEEKLVLLEEISRL